MNGIRISLVIASGAFPRLSDQIYPLLMLRMEAQVILLDLVTPSTVFRVPQELHRNLWPCDHCVR